MRALAIALAGLMLLSLTSLTIAGRHNCKPAWKCQPSPSPSTPTPAGFRLIFEEHFNVNTATVFDQAGNSSTHRLYAYPWGYDDTSNNGHYDPSIISAHDGVLDFHIQTTNGVHRVAAFGPCLSTAQDNPVAINCQQNQLYGAYEVRARVDSMHGYKGAWLLWPQRDPWPQYGEIDSPEGDFDASVSAFMHYEGAFIDGSGTVRGPDGSLNHQDWFPSGTTWNDWHVWRTEWTPGNVRFYVDGRLFGHSTRYVPSTPMRWTIQNETTLDGFEPADSVSGHGYIDYLKVWAYQ